MACGLLSVPAFAGEPAIWPPGPFPPCVVRTRLLRDYTMAHGEKGSDRPYVFACSDQDTVSFGERLIKLSPETARQRCEESRDGCWWMQDLLRGNARVFCQSTVRPTGQHARKRMLCYQFQFLREGTKWRIGEVRFRGLGAGRHVLKRSRGRASPDESAAPRND